MGENLGMVFAPSRDALGQRLPLLRLVFQPPLWFGYLVGEAGGQLTATEDGGELGAAQCRLRECPLCRVVGGLRAIDAYYDCAPLLFLKLDS